MNFEACLSLPHNPREAALIADNLEALARALRDWPTEAWQQLATKAADGSKPNGLFERLAQKTASEGLDGRQQAVALASAQAAAAVLRVLWPEAALAHPAETLSTQEEDRLVPSG
jgi:hypothetical protein